MGGEAGFFKINSKNAGKEEDILLPAFLLLSRGVATFRVEFQFSEGCGGTFRIEFAIAGEFRECRRNDRFSIDFEVCTEMSAVIAASKAIGAERDKTAGEPRCKRIRLDLHVITRSNDRTLGAIQRLDDVGLLLGCFGV